MDSGPILVGSYDYYLVVLSVFISILASYSALDLAGRVTVAQGRIRLLWVSGGAIAMGLGIWSMHYVGMLALRLPVPVMYDWPTVLLSLLAAILASAVALVLASRPTLGVFRAIFGSAFMGGGIAAMHYIGMAAMRAPVVCQYSTWIVTLSVVLAVAISLVAILLTFNLRGQKKNGGWKKPVSALAMGLAIPLMHYTGMAAVNFHPAALPADTLAHAVSISSLGVVSIICATSTVLAVVLVTARLDRQFAIQAFKLEMSEQRYHRIVETTFDAFVGMNSDGLIVDWNSKAESIFGWARSQAVGRNLSEMLATEESVADKQEHLRFLMTSLQAVLLKKPMQMKGLHRDGHEFFVELTMSAINLTNEQMFAVFIHDVTEQIQATERLRSSMMELQNLKDALDQHAIVARADPQGLITFANEKFCAISKYSREELMGRDHRIVNSKHHSEDFMTDLWKTIQGGQTWKGELKNRAKDGSEYWLSTTIVPFCDAQGKPREYIAIRTDITALKQVESELRQAKDTAENANKSKGEFLANMSHEIRTPLNGVIGMTDLALGTELSSEQREYLDTVKISADSLLTVINDILDFSKIEAGRVDLEAADFDLRDCMESTLKTLALRADVKGLELLCEVAHEVPEVVCGDSSRLRQVVVNLVGNSIKFTEQGEVGLKVQVLSKTGNDQTLQFTVSDTGIGIAPEKQKLIFEPFSQADGSTTRKYGGTGLGLTISTRLVELMGGSMWIESEVGRGTRFHFTVRLGIADLVHPTLEIAAAPEVLRDKRVLVVDDNRTNRRILDGMLTRWQMKPTCVESGMAALQHLSDAETTGIPYTLLLTDMHMPMMDGFGLIERVRENPGLSSLTILILTSAGRRGDSGRCNALGVAGYLLKPIRQSELREAIALALGPRKQSPTAPLITRYAVQDTGAGAIALRVLLAEDNAVNQRLASRLLEKRGHQVTLAGNGHEAVAALDSQIFDLILMDMQMPEKDGFEATAAIRQKEKHSGAHVPIIALTAHAMKGDKERCLAGGMDDYLSKPIRSDELDALLEKYSLRGTTSPVRVVEIADQPK